MAEALVRVSDGADGHYAFDPVRIEPDGFTWGRLESLDVWVSQGNLAADWPKKGVFVIVSVPGVDHLLFKFLEEEGSLDVERDDVDGNRVLDKITLKARKYSADITSILSADDLLKLTNGGTITLSLSDFNGAGKLKKRDNVNKNKKLSDVQARDPSVVAV